jgi:hypothetical protein
VLEGGFVTHDTWPLTETTPHLAGIVDVAHEEEHVVQIHAVHLDLLRLDEQHLIGRWLELLAGALELLPLAVIL